MERRNFFKILSTASAGALATGCGADTDKLIPLLVPEQDLIPGVEYWHPSVCTSCSAGCGVVARVMDGERIIEKVVDGKPQQFRQRLAAIKKLEGNPLDHISGGRLCARGQAGVQSLYNPDRIKSPLKRTGNRGSGTFQPISWKDAIAEAAAQLGKAKAATAILVSPAASGRSVALQRFAKALGAPEPVVCSLADHAVERRAAEVAFGWHGLPFYDVANARHILSVGADFLGGWVSPVFYARQFGAFRQGREEVRGNLVQAESRLSITASAADQWLPLRPGSEPQFLAAIGRLLLDLNLAPKAAALPAPVLAGLKALDLKAAMAATGIDEKKMRHAAEQLGRSEGPLVMAGASVVHTNSVDAVVLSHYLNMMLGKVGVSGGVQPPAKAAIEAPAATRYTEALAQAGAVILDETNPIYASPKASGVREALTKTGFVLSFASALDDSAAYADLILPAHHPLEAESVVAPATSGKTTFVVGSAFVQPLYDTRPVPDTLSELASAMGLTFQAPTAKELGEPLLPKDGTWENALRDGGIWLEDSKPPAAAPPKTAAFAAPAASFQGEAGQYPFFLQPYQSPQFGDGSGANLPWLQETPDPASSAVWSLPAEIDPVTANKLGIRSGDAVKIESPFGAVTVPAYVHPGAVPGVISMAIGGGHTNSGRYATGRGANPLEILAFAREEATGALATGATRVRLSRLGESKDLIQYSAKDKEERPHAHR